MNSPLFDLFCYIFPVTKIVIQNSITKEVITIKARVIGHYYFKYKGYWYPF